MFFKSKGYKVALKGRSGVLYSEGDHKAQIEAEMLAGSTDFVIYFDMFNSWLPPFENEAITSEDKQRIKQNISQELESKGLVIEWD